MNSRLDDLAGRIDQGEEAAFSEFGQRYKRLFYSYFRRCGIHDAAARDLTCNCLSDIPLKVKGNYTLGTNFNAWVFTLARRAALTWFRKEKRFDAVPLPSDLPEPAPGNPEAPSTHAHQVTEAMERLEPIDQEILHLRYDGFETPSFPAIAAELSQRHGREIMADTVRQRHGRALKRLKELLQELGLEESKI